MDQDDREAVRLFRQAAEGGYPRAWHFLGLSYDQGTGVEQNAQEAFRCFLAAAQGDYTEALCQTGMCYYFGHGTERDYDRAAEYFCRGAEREHPRSMTRLGVCYETGHGVEQDVQRAEDLYRRAVALGELEGQYCLAGLLRRRKAPESHREAAHLLQKPAAVGMPRPSICWGCATKPATGWRKSHGTPRTCITGPPCRATRSHARLGICYETGVGTEKDPAIAANLYRRAAEQGSDLARCRLGRLYERGLGWSRTSAGRRSCMRPGQGPECPGQRKPWTGSGPRCPPRRSPSRRTNRWTRKVPFAVCWTG